MSDYVTQEEFRVVCLGLLDAQNRIAKLEAKLLAVKVGGGQ
jgi:BMFP domain-containing protein YqiC